jgi:hypothetical protein
MGNMSEAIGTTVTLTLNNRDADALRDLTRRTGRTAEDLVGEAVHRFLAPPTAGDWSAAVLNSPCSCRRLTIWSRYTSCFCPIIPACEPSGAA